MNPELSAIVASLLFTAISSALMGAFVLYKKPHSKISLTWFLTSISVGGWSFFISLSMTSADHERALILARMANLIAAFIPTFFIHFCFYVTNSRNKIPVILGYFNSLIVLCFFYTDFFLSVVPKYPFLNYAAPALVYHYFTIHFFGLAIYAEIILLRKILSGITDPLKNQLKYILVGTSLGFASGFNYFLPVYDLPMMPVIPYFIWSYAAIISYAIVRHRLMDVTVVFRKGLIYSVLVAATSSIYFILVYSAGVLFQNYAGYKSLPEILIVFAIIAFVFKPIEKKTREIVDKFLLRRSPEQLERENDLLRQEVQKQDKMKAVATLAAGMAHEIKNPLTAIKTFTEHLPAKIDDPAFVRRFHSIVSLEVNKIDQIVKGLLDFSKPTPLLLEKVSLQEILDHLTALLNEQITRLNIQVIKSYTGDLSLFADKKQLNQALLNLLLNSLESMKEGGTLNIICTGNDRDCVIRIKDSGAGIKKEDLGRVFDPFFTTKETGTGLGLSVVHQIVEQHRGKIEITSEVGGGTNVVIELPRSV